MRVVPMPDGRAAIVEAGVVLQVCASKRGAQRRMASLLAGNPHPYARKADAKPVSSAGHVGGIGGAREWRKGGRAKPQG